MKRSGFKKKTLAEIKEKQSQKKARTPLKRSTKPKVKSKSKKRQKTQAQLKKLLDSIFSVYIRQKYPAECYTCGKKDVSLQCGHFISRSYLATRFDENNCRPQCLTAESKIRMFNGLHKNISKICVGDILWAFDKENYEYVKSEVLEIKNFTPDILYEVETEDGKKFWATADHQVVVNGKWRRIDSMLQDVTTCDILER